MKQTDLVPALRADLVLSQEPRDVGLHTVTIKDPVSQKSLNVRGFELSICRMMNGTRTVADVCAAAQAIGIPVTPEKLGALLARLNTLGLLAPKPAAPAPPPAPVAAPPSAPVGAAMKNARSLTWFGRAQWSSQTRAHYQNALKEARLDHLENAKRDVMKLLETAPDTEEAKVLLGWIDEQIASKAAGQKRQTFADVFAEVEHEWSAEESVRLERSELMRRRRQKLLAPALLGFAALLVFVPLPFRATAHWRLQAGPTEPVLAQSEGEVERVLVSEGQRVEAGQVLAQLARKPTEKGRARPPAPEPVRAPVAGWVRALAMRSGAAVEVGQELCRLDAGKKLEVVVELPVGIAADPRMTVKIAGRDVEVKRDSVVERLARGEVDATDELREGVEGNVKLWMAWRALWQR